MSRATEAARRTFHNVYVERFSYRIGEVGSVGFFTACRLSANGSRSTYRDVLDCGQRMTTTLTQVRQCTVAAPRQTKEEKTPLSLFNARLAAGELREDPRQMHAIKLLDDIFHKLKVIHPARSKPSNLTMVDNVASSKSWFGKMLQSPQSHQSTSQSGSNAKKTPGLYMWGGVGTGKTFLMSAFIEAAPKQFKVRYRHFHEFMRDVHMRLHQESGEEVPVLKVADAIASEVRVICLDELFVHNVADAMILSRLFGRLWDRGVTLIATSNRVPEDLYKGGLQRALFVPFIERLRRECLIHDMDSVTDHRRLATATVGAYFVRLVEGRSNDDRLESALRKSAGTKEWAPAKVEVQMGRTLRIPSASGKVCSFSFEELCGSAVGAADYSALAEVYHTVALKGVPIFTAANKDTAYRFETLIDVLYDKRIKLLVSAEGYPGDLFKNIFTFAEKDAATGPDSVVDNKLGFTKDRTVSRLVEMQTYEYSISHAEAHDPSLKLAIKEKLAKLKQP